MPIYAYRCEACGFAKDVLQKISDPVLTDCPECGKSTFKKQLTAAGFQLKGTGWYVTDFRNNGSAPASSGSSSSNASGTSTASSAAAASTSPGSESSSSSAATPAPASTPAAPTSTT